MQSTAETRNVAGGTVKLVCLSKLYVVEPKSAEQAKIILKMKHEITTGALYYLLVKSALDKEFPSETSDRELKNDKNTIFYVAKRCPSKPKGKLQSFLLGIAHALDLGGTLKDDHTTMLVKLRSDHEAVATDWEAVKRDLYDAFNKTYGKIQRKPRFGLDETGVNRQR